MPTFVLRFADDHTPTAAATSTQHSATARALAATVAEQTGRAVEVCTDTDGAIRSRFTMQPDGTRSRPDGTRSSDRMGDCKRDSGQRCFCVTCRSERREGRKRPAEPDVIERTFGRKL